MRGPARSSRGWGSRSSTRTARSTATFGGGDGRRIVDVPGGDFDFVFSLSLAAGNKLVAAVAADGTAVNRFVAMRLNADGSPGQFVRRRRVRGARPGPVRRSCRRRRRRRADGGVVVGGGRYLTSDLNGPLETTLVKLTASGNPDTAGGDAGYVHGTFADDLVQAARRHRRRQDRRRRPGRRRPLQRQRHPR